MGEDREDENKRRKKSREGVEKARDTEKEERRKEADSDGREKVFCL